MNEFGCLSQLRWVLRSIPLLALGTTATSSISAPFTPDREFFFEQCRILSNYSMSESGNTAVLSGRTRLSESMMSGINHLFDVWEKFGDEDPNRLAFVLATARRESQSSFSPIREAPKCGANEICREQAIGRLLQKRAEKAKTVPRSNYALPDSKGRRYYGRGFIQLTFKDNYQKTGDMLNVDLVANPDMALDPEVSGEILVRAMLEGWYGSKKPLAYYINGNGNNWMAARNNVNPGSPNKPITASYGKEIAKCLRPAK